MHLLCFEYCLIATEYPRNRLCLNFIRAKNYYIENPKKNVFTESSADPLPIRKTVKTSATQHVKIKRLNLIAILFFTLLNLDLLLL